MKFKYEVSQTGVIEVVDEKIPKMLDNYKYLMDKHGDLEDMMRYIAEYCTIYNRKDFIEGIGGLSGVLEFKNEAVEVFIEEEGV